MHTLLNYTQKNLIDFRGYVYKKIFFEINLLLCRKQKYSIYNIFSYISKIHKSLAELQQAILMYYFII